MKTLREYIDRLDEISRRDFLKTAGAAAVGAASDASAFSPFQSGFVSGAMGANQRRQELELEIPDLRIMVATDDNAASADQLSDRDQETIIKLIHLYLLNGMDGGNERYRSLAWESLNKLAANWKIRSLLKARADQIKQHYVSKQTTDPEYWARLKRIYTTNQQIQNQVYDEAQALIDKGRRLSGSR